MNSQVVAILDDPSARDLISVSWDTSNICNYRCSYCHDGYNGGTHPFPSLEKIKSFLTELAEKTGKRIYIEMKGGEPTYWREISEFLDLCHSNTWGVCLVTNGTRPLSWWEQNISKIPSVAVSLHPEFVNIEEMAEKLSFIYNRIVTHSMYLMYPPLFEKAQKDLEYLAHRFPDLPLEAVVVARPKDNRIFEYTADQEEFIRKFNARPMLKHPMPQYPFPFPERTFSYMLDVKNNFSRVNPQEVKLQSMNTWKGWACHAGLDRIHIEVNGEIYRGQCRSGGSLGNLHTGEYQFPETAVICGKSICFCGAEVILRKWNPDVVSVEL